MLSSWPCFQHFASGCSQSLLRSPTTRGSLLPTRSRWSDLLTPGRPSARHVGSPIPTFGRFEAKGQLHPAAAGHAAAPAIRLGLPGAQELFRDGGAAVSPGRSYRPQRNRQNTVTVPVHLQRVPASAADSSLTSRPVPWLTWCMASFSTSTQQAAAGSHAAGDHARPIEGQVGPLAWLKQLARGRIAYVAGPAHVIGQLHAAAIGHQLVQGDGEIEVALVDPHLQVAGEAAHQIHRAGKGIGGKDSAVSLSSCAAMIGNGSSHAAFHRGRPGPRSAPAGLALAAVPAGGGSHRPKRVRPTGGSGGEHPRLPPAKAHGPSGWRPSAGSSRGRAPAQDAARRAAHGPATGR